MADIVRLNDRRLDAPPINCVLRPPVHYIGDRPTLLPEIVPHVEPIVRKAEPTLRDQLRFAIAYGLDNLIMFEIEHCRLGGRTREAEARRDVLNRLAAGPVEAAETLLAAHRGRLPHYHV